MAVSDLDAMLDRLTAAADTVGANLLELERDADYEVLRHMTLRGETLRRWQAAETALARVWAWFGALRGVLDDAQTTKSSRTRRELLTAASVKVAAPDVPLRDRDLLQPASLIEAHTPEDAIALMQREFDAVRLVVGAVGLTWDVNLPRLRAAEATLDTISSIAADLRADGLPPVRLREDIASLADDLMTDPLSVSPESVDALSTRVGGAETEIAKALALRNDVTGALGEANDLARRVEEGVATAQAAHAEVIAKIVDPELPALPGDVDAIVSELDAIQGLVADNRWMDVRTQLTEWSARAMVTLGELERLTAAVRLPLEQRNELRGRLDAYHAKVGRLHRSEDAELDARYETARSALYTAPTDLGHAAQLVTDYAEAIPAERPSKTAGRSR